MADICDVHPESTTAGIEESLAALPPEGGTLWFPRDRGPYVVTRKPQAVRNYYDLGGGTVSSDQVVFKGNVVLQATDRPE